MPLNLQNGLGDVCGLLLAVVLVEIQAEALVSN
jgi:hypothetical protein